MVNEEVFVKIYEDAKNFKYNSMNYICFDGCKNAEIIKNDNTLILLQDKAQTPSMLHFAVDDFEYLLEILADMRGKLRLHFVPRKFAVQLEELGFTEWAEYADFWNADLASTATHVNNIHNIEYLCKDECEEVSLLSQKCKLQSRGYKGEAKEWFVEWLNENKVIIVRKDSMIFGFCCVSIYNEGTTLWIREIAVDPAYQGIGIGKKLMEQAILYGIENGAVKGFLAADILNKNAIGLYNKYNFVSKNVDSELQMIKE